ncbi:MAG TPA: RNA-binding protein [Polyangia bacterium]
MNRGYAGGKRQREAERDRKRKEKEERLMRNRNRAPEPDPNAEPDLAALQAAKLPEIPLDQIAIGVAARPRHNRTGPTKLFVGGLSWDTTSDDLRTAFARFGAISDAAVVLDRATGRSRGFGFVTVEQATDALEAVKQMNGAELDGRTLKVNAAEAR